MDWEELLTVFSKVLYKSWIEWQAFLKSTEVNVQEYMKFVVITVSVYAYYVLISS